MKILSDNGLSSETKQILKPHITDVSEAAYLGSLYLKEVYQVSDKDIKILEKLADDEEEIWNGPKLKELPKGRIKLSFSLIKYTALAIALEHILDVDKWDALAEDAGCANTWLEIHELYYKLTGKTHRYYKKYRDFHESIVSSEI
jgi:hypothetical protein